MLEISRCRPSAKGIFFRSDVGEYRPISITSVLSEVFENIVAGQLHNFLKGNSLLPPSQFSYRRHRGIGKCDDLIILSYQLQVDVYGGMEGELVQLGFFSCI